MLKFTSNWLWEENYEISFRTNTAGKLIMTQGEKSLEVRDLRLFIRKLMDPPERDNQGRDGGPYLPHREIVDTRGVGNDEVLIFLGEITSPDLWVRAVLNRKGLVKKILTMYEEATGV